MQAIKKIAFAFVMFSAAAQAETDPECLQHLGGAFSGVECYNGLTNDLRVENKRLSKEIAESIPKSSNSKGLLGSYMKNEINSEKFCNLEKESYAGWQIDHPLKAPRYHDYDVVYFECVYSRALEQNRFLKKIHKNINP